MPARGRIIRGRAAQAATGANCRVASAMLPEMQRASVVLLLISSRSHHGPRTGFRGVGFWQSGTTLTGANKEEVGIDRPVQRPRPAHHRCVVSELRKYL